MCYGGDGYTPIDRFSEAMDNMTKAKIELEQTSRALGFYMRTIREVKGVSLRELARMCGCSAVFISDLETGRRRWNKNWIKQYQSRLNKIRVKEQTK